MGNLIRELNDRQMRGTHRCAHSFLILILKDSLPETNFKANAHLQSLKKKNIFPSFSLVFSADMKSHTILTNYSYPASAHGKSGSRLVPNSENCIPCSVVLAA